MRHRNQFDQPLFTGRGQRLQVAVQHRSEGLLGLPFRMHGRHRLHAVECKGKLDVHRLLDPQRAVIVEHGDALRFRHEVDTPGSPLPERMRSSLADETQFWFFGVV